MDAHTLSSLTTHNNAIIIWRMLNYGANCHQMTDIGRAVRYAHEGLIRSTSVAEGITVVLPHSSAIHQSNSERDSECHKTNSAS